MATTNEVFQALFWVGVSLAMALFFYFLFAKQHYRILAAISIFVAVEVVARLIGFGDPPLYMHDPAIEYRGKPGTYSRFRNTISYNSFSMRSGDFGKKKRNELRVLVVGDSVVNGGALTDQAKLATSLVENMLPQPATVANISAGRWGPPNFRAYIEKFGTFDADLLILFLNSEDYGDVHTASLLGDPDHPVTKPILASWEIVSRYGPRLFQPAVAPPTKEDVETSMSAVRALLRLPIKVIVVQHLRRDERIKEHAGYTEIGLAAKEANRQTIRLQLPDSAYRDDMHPNDEGQKVMADYLYQAILSNITERPGHTPRKQ